MGMSDSLSLSNPPGPDSDWQAWLESRLPEARRGLLHKAGEMAVRMGMPLYLVGGFVRDGLLNLAPNDFDLVVEGAAPRLAQALARELGGEVTVHAPFSTATWQTPEGWTVDFATARTETYARPAALPEVQPADLAADLHRRDITINAMALQLGPGGQLRDPYHGRADLADGLIRGLYPTTFQDDPTRLFRAVRYEQRLGFRVEPETLSWMAEAWEALDTLSADRLRHEFELIFREPQASAMLARLAELDILRHTHPALRWGDLQAAGAAEIPRLPLAEWKLAGALEPDALYLTLMLAEASPAGAEGALARLNVNRLISEAVRAALGLKLTASRPSQVATQLDGLAETALAAAYVRYPAWRGALHDYLACWRWVRPAITGDDLVAMGLTPGPFFKVILQQVRAARLDGWVSDEAGERELVRQLLTMRSADGR